MKFLQCLAVLLVASVLCSQKARAAEEDEIALYNSNGRAQAYVDRSDEFTVYLWTGEPVAYLAKEQGGYAIWGFNGKHLGWLSDGIVYDHKGHIVAALKECFQSETHEGMKELKNPKPPRSDQERPGKTRLQIRMVHGVDHPGIFQSGPLRLTIPFSNEPVSIGRSAPRKITTGGPVCVT